MLKKIVTIGLLVGVLANLAGAEAAPGGGRHRGGRGRKLARFDANHDGRLDPGERTAAIQAIMASPKFQERMARRGKAVDEEKLRSRLDARLARWKAGEAGAGRGQRRPPETTMPEPATSPETGGPPR